MTIAHLQSQNCSIRIMSHYPTKSSSEEEIFSAFSGELSLCDGSIRLMDCFPLLECIKIKWAWGELVERKRIVNYFDFSSEVMELILDEEASSVDVKYVNTVGQVQNCRIQISDLLIFVNTVFGLSTALLDLYYPSCRRDLPYLFSA